MIQQRSKKKYSLLPGIPKKGKYCFILYAFVYLGFSIRIFPRDIAVGLMTLVFLYSPLDTMPFLYFFSLPWTYVAKFSFGITLSLLQSIIYIAKKFFVRKKFKLAPFELILMVFLLFSGIAGFFINQSFTEISFVFYFLIVCDIKREFFRAAETRNEFMSKMLFSILLSVSIAIIYGMVYNTSHARWIGNLGGYSNQLSGTLGTSRFGMYLCIAMLYPLYHVKNTKLKIALCVFLTVAVLSTISLTAVILLMVVYITYLLMKMKNIKKVLIILSVLCIFFGAVYVLWEPISNIPYLKPVISRINFSLIRARAGDFDNATSGRSELADNYMMSYSDLPLMSKLFGAHSIKSENAQYSHNSYIDMLNCLGIIGCVILLILQLRRFMEYMKCYERNELILLKMIVLIGAATVSIFTAQYWQVFLYF